MIENIMLKLFLIVAKIVSKRTY